MLALSGNMLLSLFPDLQQHSVSMAIAIRNVLNMVMLYGFVRKYSIYIDMNKEKLVKYAVRMVLMLIF